MAMLQLDHLVFATPDLASTAEWFATQTGVEGQVVLR